MRGTGGSGSLLTDPLSLPPPVLADALHVAAGPLSSPGPGRSLSLRLGEPFELRCEAATASPLHTHLALLWELRHGAARQRVLALTREGRLHPGPGYEPRYRGGDVRLDTWGGRRLPPLREPRPGRRPGRLPVRRQRVDRGAGRLAGDPGEGRGRGHRGHPAHR